MTDQKKEQVYTITEKGEKRQDTDALGQVLCAISGGSVSRSALRIVFEDTEYSEDVDADDEVRQQHAEIIANLPTLLEQAVKAGFLAIA